MGSREPTFEPDARSSNGRRSAISVLLVTTGSTAWEDQERLCGATDLAMSEEGRQRFDEQLQAMEGEKHDQVYCGPDEACVEAAELVAKAIGGRKKVVESLAEVGLGLWEGQASRGSGVTPSQGVQAVDGRSGQRGPAGG